MTEPGVLTLPLPDAPARDRIGADLATNLLVEAGAGSGKTTALVGRMTALVATGAARVEQIAAVTFTRKAAAELRQRFQEALEEALRAARDDEAVDRATAERLMRALEGVDRSFVGTIHAFCARLLRERPLEIGLDPSFEELPVEQRDRLRRDFWAQFVERLTRDSDPILEDLARAGIGPSVLETAFDHLVENPDVDFPAAEISPPSASELAGVRRALEELVDHGHELMGDRRPDKDWDSLQKKLRRLHFTREVTGWQDPAQLFDAIAELCKPGPNGHRIVQKRWRDKDMAKSLLERVDAFGVGDTPARGLLDRWHQHRYALALRMAGQAARDFAAYRARIGRLDFQDLLVLTARLLRAHPGVRRELGERYRYLLVDEFQDTDPLQAEIMLLLASEPAATISTGDDSRDETPSTEEPGELGAWRRAEPRPGALFVVGDPKQSIYRFRRADIQLYGFVKRRFEDFGAVVELTTNFRSRPRIGDLVNEVFAADAFFPAQATPEQAAFEPLVTRPAARSLPTEGVFVYDLAPGRNRKDVIAGDDAARLATWIRARLDAGDRRPGDFLILTRYRTNLPIYARALEERSVPVQVTGAGVGAEHELHELQVLLECLVDPANPVKVTSALVGLFFGIDYERLVEHRLAGGRLDAMWPGDEGREDVLEALRALSRWWRAATTMPADILVTRLVDELGLLPYTAAGELGALRAGALVYALDAVRAAVLGGDASLPGALAAMRSALALTEAEAPLEPGRADVVRLMNLHQAKGLEASVVVLADPSKGPDPAPDLHTERGADGAAVGYLRVTERRTGFGSDKTLAAPADWERKEAAERGFTEAEEVRLLYVAVTRAREELVVARWSDGKGSSWSALEPWLSDNAEPLPMQIVPPEPRASVELDPEAARAAVRSASERLALRSRPSYEHVSVTELAKSRAEPSEADAAERSPTLPGAVFRGVTWGSAVHGALAAAAAPEPTLEGLRAACRDLLVEHGRPLDDHGEPTELDELLDLVRAVRDSELWTRALASEQVLVEIPFASPGAPGADTEVAEASPRPDGRARRQLDLFGDSTAPDAPDAGTSGDPRTKGADRDGEGAAGEHVRVLEGIIDLAFREPEGWVIADYKTDLGTDPDFAIRSATYRRQVDLYARAWAELTGEPIKERVLFFTAQSRTETW